MNASAATGGALEDIIRAYSEAVFDTDRARARRVVDEALARGVTPEDVVFRLVVPGVDGMMAALGRTGEVSLAQHFMAAQIAGEVTEAMIPRFRSVPEVAGRVIIGNSAGDFHALGKRIVAGCLRALMMEVVDLGVNVPPERFVDEAAARGAQVIAISSMMLHTARGERGCLAVRRLLRERGLEGRVKVAVGGAPYRLDRELWRVVQADAWAENGLLAARAIAALVKEVAP